MSTETLERQQPQLYAAGLDAVHFAVIDSISSGNTIRQTARNLQMVRGEVEAAKKELAAHFDTFRLPLIVNRAIQTNFLPVTVEPNEEVRASLRRSDPAILKLYAEGGSNDFLAEIAGTSPKSIQRYQGNLYKKIGAWTSAHAVRRSYELGILTVFSDEGWN